MPVLNRYLQTIVRATKSLGMEYSVTDIANMVRLRRETVQRNITQMDKYRKKCDTASADDIRFMEARSLEIMLGKAKTIKEQLGAIAGHKLRYQTQTLARLNTSVRVIEVGTAAIEICRLILQTKDRDRKHKNEGKVYSRKAAVRTLQHQVADIIDMMFHRRYESTSTRKLTRQTKYESFIWSINPLMLKVLEDTIYEYVNTHLSTTITAIQPYTQMSHLFVYLCIGYPRSVTLGNVATLSHITPVKPKVFVVSLETFRLFNFQSQLHLLSAFNFFNSQGNMVFSANHTSSTNQHLGRSYNVVSQILADERKLADYTNYDISAALQVIALHFVDNALNKYPMLYRYSRVKKYKQYMRISIAESMGWEVSKVKQELTAYSNGKVCREHNALLQQFAKESDRLRREFMRAVWISEPEVVDRAIKQSRRTINTDTEWIDAAMDNKAEIARDKASIFFFTWTWYERKIRMAMLKIIDDGIEVHDAVYSKYKNISLLTLRKHIKAETGFTMMLTKD